MQAFLSLALSLVRALIHTYNIQRPTIIEIIKEIGKLCAAAAARTFTQFSFSLISSLDPGWQLSIHFYCIYYNATLLGDYYI